jgi:hypothetical protein
LIAGNYYHLKFFLRATYLNINLFLISEMNIYSPVVSFYSFISFVIKIDHRRLLSASLIFGLSAGFRTGAGGASEANHLSTSRPAQPGSHGRERLKRSEAC